MAGVVSPRAQEQLSWDAAARARRVVFVSADGSSADKTTLIDEASSTVTYIGEAALGTATSASLWRIKKISVSGTVTTIAWAGGVSTFTKEWDERTSYTYT